MCNLYRLWLKCRINLCIICTLWWTLNTWQVNDSKAKRGKCFLAFIITVIIWHVCISNDFHSIFKTLHLSWDIGYAYMCIYMQNPAVLSFPNIWFIQVFGVPGIVPALGLMKIERREVGTSFSCRWNITHSIFCNAHDFLNCYSRDSSITFLPMV